MRLSRKWLEKFVDLSKISNLEISKALNSLGFEVEQEQDYAKLNDELIIGYVENSEPIPNTHLSLNKVNIGQKTLLEIVCGAPNVCQGQYVIVAEVGKTLANGLTLTEREIKGYKSQGMICALNEIGIENKVLTPEEMDSIYAIHSLKDLQNLLGHPIREIGYDDFVWEVDLTLNRSDALGAIQLLKEIANYFDLKIVDTFLPNPHSKNTSQDLSADTLVLECSQELEAKTNLLSSRLLTLKSCPVNNLVVEDDLLLKKIGIQSTTNFWEDLALLSAWETGQPLILIDNQKLSGVLKLEKKLIGDKELVVLTNDNKLVQILGLPTEQTYAPNIQTQELVVLTVSLDNSLMRKQQKELAGSSTALQRYMKPISSQAFRWAISSFILLLQRYGLFENLSKEKMLVSKTNLETNAQQTISLAKIEKILGVSLTATQVQNLFRTLDFQISVQKDLLTFQIDPLRTDIYGQNDLCEEIARLYGYDNIPETRPSIMTNQTKNNSFATDLQNKVQNYLIGSGFANVKTYSLVNQQEAEHWNLFNLPNPITLLSPLSKRHQTYRLTLIPSLIELTSFNSANDNKNLKLWEIADVYSNNGARERHLALSTTGNILQEPLLHTTIENNYFYLKGILEAIFHLYNLDTTQIRFHHPATSLREIHPFINAEIRFQDQILGFIFRLNPKFENNKKLQPTIVAELNLDLLGQLAPKSYTFTPLSKFQASSRDLSVVVPITLEYQVMVEKLLVGVQKITSFKLIDQYQNQEMQQNQEQVLTLSFVFNDWQKQMTETEIAEQWTQILKNVQQLGVVVR